MTPFFLKIFDLFQRKRGLCFGLLFAIIIFLLLMVASIKYNENIYDFLPISGNDQKAITLYQDISGGQRIVGMVKTKSVEDEEAAMDRMTEAVDSFANHLQRGEGEIHFKDITSHVDYEKYASLSDFIYQNIPFMLSDSDYVRMEQIINSPALADEQMANDIQMMMMPATGFFTSNISNDPLSLFAPIFDKLQKKQASMPFDIDNGYIFTSDKKYALLMLTSPYGSVESANNARLVSIVDSAASKTMQDMPDVDVAFTGSPVIAVGNASQIKKDSVWAISIAVTLILLLLFYSFRNIKNLLLIGMSIVFGWLFAIGFISALRSDVSLIVLGIGSIIIGIAVNYPLHFVAHIDHGGTIREVLKEMIAPLLIGNITTVGAFASLMPLDAPALRDLGFFAAFMLIGTILFVLMFLPHLVKAKKAATKEHLLFGKVTSKTPETQHWLLWVILAITVVLGYFSLGTSFDANMHHINYMTPQQKELLSDLHATAGMNDTSNVYLVSEGRTWDEALAQRAKMNPVLDSLKATSDINTYTDVTSYICDANLQKEKIRKWNDFWEKYREKTTTLIDQLSNKYEFSEDAFEGFEKILTQEYKVQPFDYFEPIKSVLLTSSFSKSTGNCSVIDIINAKGKDLDKVESILNEESGNNGYAFDFTKMNSSVANSLSDDFNYIGFACGFIVFIFLWISFGRLELATLSFLPMALGWIWILGIMTLFGMQFNIVNVILATFIFGQGDDYTIFMTDGLLNEYAYRKKLLPSYKNSIIISALIMFIGMGSLIIAKHPALHSLAEVTIVGMLTVVFMAWVVPPLVFGWLIKTDNKFRKVPVTIEQMVRTIVSTLGYLVQLTYGCVIGFFVNLMPNRSNKPEKWFRQVIHKTMLYDTTHLPGVKYVVKNEHQEEFKRGSVLICNHQSMLDPVCMLSLNPNILVLVSDKVWNNPIVHTLFKLARFIRLNQPMEDMQADIAQAVKDGYSVVIFPEGKRTDNQIMRFHKGSFQIAKEIGADILPVFLHGAGHVLPKGSGFAARGQITVEIGKRVPADQLDNYGDSVMEITHSFHKLYKDHFEEMKKEIEDTHYFHHYIIYKYIYKGIGVEKETRRLLKKYIDFSEWIDKYVPKDEKADTVSIMNAGRGQFSLLFALVHPNVNVESYAFDEDDAKLAECCEPLPKNLHIHYVENAESALKAAEGTTIIDLSKIISE